MLLSTSSKDQTRRFFGRLSSHYQDLIKTRRYLGWMRPIIESRMGEKVLDVGNGGVREFSSVHTSLYVGLDSSLEMFKGGDEGLQKVCGDASCLAFRGEVFDTVFYRSLLHHLADKNAKRTEEAVKVALGQGFASLKREGNVLIVEPCLPFFFEKIERIFYFFLRIFFFLTKQSEVFLFSSDTLHRILLESGYHEIKTWEARELRKDRWKWVSPFIGLPLLRIPRWFNPTRRTILEGKKKG